MDITTDYNVLACLKLPPLFFINWGRDWARLCLKASSAVAVKATPSTLTSVRITCRRPCHTTEPNERTRKEKKGVEKIRWHKKEPVKANPHQGQRYKDQRKKEVFISSLLHLWNCAKNEAEIRRAILSFFPFQVQLLHYGISLLEEINTKTSNLDSLGGRKMTAAFNVMFVCTYE